jgi:hypothetical protein
VCVKLSTVGRKEVIGMERKEMIELLMLEAECALDLVMNYDPTGPEKERVMLDERARLEKKTDLQLQNMVVINCA